MSLNQSLRHCNVPSLLGTSAHSQTLVSAFVQGVFEGHMIYMWVPLIILQITLWKSAVFLYRNTLFTSVCVCVLVMAFKIINIFMQGKQYYIWEMDFFWAFLQNRGHLRLMRRDSCASGSVSPCRASGWTHLPLMICPFLCAAGWGDAALGHPQCQIHHLNILIDRTVWFLSTFPNLVFFKAWSLPIGSKQHA